MPLNGPALGHLQILLVEDSAEDAELICDMLEQAGVAASFQRVDDEDGLVEVLSSGRCDIVLSDLSMPGFCGMRALELVRGLHPRMPFVFVSGTIGEEMAVQALQQGAADYILKHSPGRLPSAVARAVREARSEAERARVEAELMRAQRLESMSLIAAGLSHDLRNILQPLLIVPDLLKTRSDDPRIHQLADVISECGLRGNEMAESMLSFVRGSRRSSERIEVERLFNAVDLLLRGSLPSKVELHTELKGSGLALDGNFTELQQVLLNLALNAIQAMPEGGRLQLLAEPVTDVDGCAQLCIRVIDTGIGMPSDVMERLFSPFFTTKATGTGLGLMSCKRIIEGLQGSIQVSSQVGEGSRFDLLLPISGGGAVRSESIGDLPVGNGQAVLVVDNIATRLSLLGNALSSQGYRLSLASDGAGALHHVQQHGLPEAVVIDTALPLMPASQLLRELRALGFSGPALLLEDPAQPVDPAALADGGPLHCLRKPLEMQHVFRAVDAMLAEAAKASAPA